MGLDMYLRAERHLPSYNGEGKELSENISLLVGLPSGMSVNNVTVEVGYWRKSNQIHKWFVDNVQEGNDDCGDYYVSREQLVELKVLCQTVLANREKAEELLPAQSGFFFGSTDYDQWYFQELENTISTIDGALALPNEWDFEYHSSW